MVIAQYNMGTRIWKLCIFFNHYALSHREVLVSCVPFLWLLWRLWGENIAAWDKAGYLSKPLCEQQSHVISERMAAPCKNIIPGNTNPGVLTSCVNPSLSAGNIRNNSCHRVCTWVAILCLHCSNVPLLRCLLSLAPTTYSTIFAAAENYFVVDAFTVCFIHIAGTARCCIAEKQRQLYCWLKRRRMMNESKYAWKQTSCAHGRSSTKMMACRKIVPPVQCGTAVMPRPFRSEHDTACNGRQPKLIKPTHWKQQYRRVK